MSYEIYKNSNLEHIILKHSKGKLIFNRTPYTLRDAVSNFKKGRVFRVKEVHKQDWAFIGCVERLDDIPIYFPEELL